MLHVRVMLAGLTLLLAGCSRGKTPRAADVQAWKELVDISAATQAPGIQPHDSPVSWRLWWNQQEIYPSQVTGDRNTGPQAAGSSDHFRSLHCYAESEPTVSANAPKPGRATQCEAVLLNEAASAYIFHYELWKRRTLIQAARQNAVHLPNAQSNMSRELKTEWRPLTDPKNYSRYIVAIDDKGDPYGLVAFHLMFHKGPNWTWATWLHEDYKGEMPPAIGFHDSFGARAGQTPSEALRALLAAHRLPVLEHYKLIGTQVDFTDPSSLGNPLIEGNTVEALRSVSCMGCHRYAAIKDDGSWHTPRGVTGTDSLPNGLFGVDFDFTLVFDSECLGSGPACNPA